MIKIRRERDNKKMRRERDDRKMKRERKNLSTFFLKKRGKLEPSLKALGHKISYVH